MYLAICALALLAAAPEPRDLDPKANLALGKPVSYLPAPNYGPTAAKDTDPKDLTDGVLTQRPDQHMWFESLAVGWSYAGRVNLAVDLGSVQAIDEVAVRFLGGSPQPGIWMPGWVEVMVGESAAGPWHKVAEYSRWKAGDPARFGIPTSGGKAWVHRLTFGGLKTCGRWVGLRFYGAGLTCADELYVFGGSHQPTTVAFAPATRSDFTVDQPWLHFHKPAVHAFREVPAPLPIGLAVPPGAPTRPFSVSLTFPSGVNVVGGSIGGIGLLAATQEPVPGGTRYTWRTDKPLRDDKTFGRLYVAGAPAAAPAVLRSQTTWGEQTSPETSVPLEVVDLPAEPPRPQRLMASLSWWDLGATRAWPEWAEAFRRIGFNTLPVFATWFDPNDQATLDFITWARADGWRVQAIDSTWHRMLGRRKNEAELYCQFDDGTHGKDLCPSYRGQYYAEEMERVSTAVKLLKPDYFHDDIELWSWRGPLDSPRCRRCRADKAERGIEKWEDWQLVMGETMSRELQTAVARGVAAGGGPPCELGVYDFRPKTNYQFFWPFDPLYPEVWQSAQVSTYTPLEPYHLAYVGDEVRTDRAALPRGDQLPWLTPGDAGTFPGEAFYCALLECLFNGSRGINFWSGRVWDADLLAAYARAMAVATPVEDILIDGAPYLPEVDGPGRASGLRRGDEAVVLVADYLAEAAGSVALELDFAKPIEVVDLATGEVIAKLAAGAQPFKVAVKEGGARALSVRPTRG
ncbi:MAG: hypothetical protein HUU35_10355 [Armatimonadetes bacterium]|nr:hypothetical protein [Armatimonadota bacterium]